MNVRGHGNGHSNHRTYRVFDASDTGNIFCRVDGHKWMPYKKDSTQEFCPVCGQFRKKEGIEKNRKEEHE